MINKIKNKFLSINVLNNYTSLDAFDLCENDDMYAPIGLKTLEEEFKHKKCSTDAKLFYDECVKLCSILSKITCIDRHGIVYSRYGRIKYVIICEFGYSTLIFEILKTRSNEIHCDMHATPRVMPKFIEYVEENQDILGDFISIVERIDVLDVLKNL